MHELAVTESILNIALDYAERSGATRVTDLHLVIGQLSSIIDDSVQFYWDIVSKETICEGAVLHFERIPAQMICLDCEHHMRLAMGLRLARNVRASMFACRLGRISVWRVLKLRWLS